jgi:hypothetical protein
VNHPIEPLDNPHPNQHKFAQICIRVHKLTVEEKIEGELAYIGQRLSKIDGELFGINVRLIAIESRLNRFRNIGNGLFVGMLVAYAVILAIALRAH